MLDNKLIFDSPDQDPLTIHADYELGDWLMDFGCARETQKEIAGPVSAGEEHGISQPRT
jgi:hypothetical protein